jgi:hypothetical protein
MKGIQSEKLQDALKTLINGLDHLVWSFNFAKDAGPHVLAGRVHFLEIAIQ